ncbi:MAG: cysteine desulfurase [Parashewanella sp.]
MSASTSLVSTPLADRVKRQFPVFETASNAQPFCYLDTAATSQKPLSVIEVVDNYYRNQNANVHRAAHRLSAEATFAYEGVRDKIKAFINAAQREEVIFTHGTTEAINMLAFGLAKQFNTGDVILVDTAAHHANLVPWQQLAKRTGAIIKPIPLDDSFRIDIQAYKTLLELSPKLVTVSHVTNALGTLNPVSELITLAKNSGALTVIDGAQAVAHIKVDVTALNCDYYVFSGHKMYAPTGVGILYGKKHALEQLTPMLTGGEMIKTVTFEQTEFTSLPNRLEAGTPPIASVIGLGAAIDFMQQYLTEAHQQQEQELLNYLQHSLQQLAGIEVYAAHADNHAVVAFNIEGEHHQDIGTLLDQQGIAIRCGHHCAMPLMQHMNLKGCCRVSIGMYTTKADIDFFIEGLIQVQELLS